MARGGYVRPEIALAKLRQITQSLKGAKRIIFEALKAGDLKSRGRPVKNIFERREDLDEINGSHAHAQVEIAPEYWKRAKAFDNNSWNWDSGHFVCPENFTINNRGYVEVQFKERDMNALCAQIALPTAISSTKGRLRDPSWEDWVAAVAILGHEQQISPDMKRNELLERINAKLEAWGLEELKADSTVGPAASAIIRRYRSNPPVNPVIMPATTEKKP